MTVVAPYVLSEGRIEPYVSLDEVKFSPTAAAIDFTNLVENGSQQVQDRALYDIIVRASSKADIYTMGQFGSLNATTNVENGRSRPNRSGQIVIHPFFTPILELVNFQMGPGPGAGMSTITLTSSNVSIERTQFIITPTGPMGVQFGGLGLAGGYLNYMQEVFTQYTYVNGYANTFTASSSAVGATSLTINDPTGIYPGMNLTIWDGQNTETILVSTSYVQGSTTLLLQNPTVNRHGTAVNVSALPASVKQAVIHFVVAMIKQRGQGGLVLQETGEPVAVSSKTVTSMEDEVIAYDLLDPFRVVWGRS